MALVRVYTRTGDDGSTALGDGSRVSKNTAQVAAYGDVDEVNSLVGLLRGECPEGSLKAQLERVQAALFETGAFLAHPAHRFTPGPDVTAPEWLETWIDAMEADLPPLKNFVLPGGAGSAAAAHLARAVCRRAERSVVGLEAAGDADARAVVPFLNRLSDMLFVLARWLNREAGVADVIWPGRR